MQIFILTCAFMCGFLIMAIELLGGKILSPYFGGSVYVWGSIITVFMLALSIGYLFGGKLSLKNPNTRKYGIIFMLAALSVVPLTMGHVAVSEWVFDFTDDPRYGSLLASTILFLIPTIILGMIAPYSVRLLVRTTHSSGQTAGFLYFVSTLGSAGGTLATSFYLVLWFKIDHILYGSALILFTIGLIAFFFPQPPLSARTVSTNEPAE
ncbi:fused MFS/spermidine synthase [Kangiella sp. M94]